MNELENEIKQLIISALNLEELSIDDIDSEAPLFNEGLGLDSIDALELGLALKNQFNIQLNAENEEVHQHFYSVKTLAEFIHNNQ
ncbi:acyl carrier protein [Gallibacterium salpingitidis]|uniref:Acyl carrier protein n=1 Tax=Gallibacterium salpingitidis TaxID=505341 RepID=A0A1A7P360_9PAST|nr:phosphopantetheine-binding protein [Gallibacterium salpingitidis]OBW96443.1 acyl carrier protein [Gallibacterium salpingitidis]OBX06464.1 acyl carrier protein [Gallibacterium salpingitidis]OBX08909.1 acyl carrier protein [Gallibacterium salpingitidis]WKS99403.1 phosphopantetheine-binding protein [Gallibacterium salpingitidis]